MNQAPWAESPIHDQIKTAGLDTAEGSLDAPTCSACRFRDDDGYCRSGKMWEEGIAPEDRSDCVVYDYYEGGNFWVGPNFGCVHFQQSFADDMNCEHLKQNSPLQQPVT